MTCNIFRLSLVGILAFVAAAAQAKPPFAAKEGKNCIYCHESARGGKRNYRGLYYRQHNLTFEGFDDKAEAERAGVPIGPEPEPKPRSLTPARKPKPIVIPDRPTNRSTPVQENALSVSLFKGEEGVVTLSGWGSGRAEASRGEFGKVKVGEYSIKVTTHGLYQGGRIDFAKPVDLSAALANPRCYFRFYSSFIGSTQEVVDLSGFGQQKAAAPFERMRFLFIMADGSQIEMIRPLDIPPSEDPDAYVPLHVPLQALKKAAKKVLVGNGAKLASVVISGDKFNQFNLGEIDIITDETEISVSPLDDQIAFVDNEMTFVADAEGGASTLKFSWDWDAEDGIQEDDKGRTVKHVFKKEKRHIVTLTVYDVDGLKQLGRTTITLEVAR